MKNEKYMSFLNENFILTPDGIEVPLIILLDNLRKRFNFLGKIYKFFKKSKGGEEFLRFNIFWSSEI